MKFKQKKLMNKNNKLRKFKNNRYNKIIKRSRSQSNHKQVFNQDEKCRNI